MVIIGLFKRKRDVNETERHRTRTDGTIKIENKILTYHETISSLFFIFIYISSIFLLSRMNPKKGEGAEQR